MCVIANAAFGDKSPEVMDNFDEDFVYFETNCDVGRLDSELVMKSCRCKK